MKRLLFSLMIIALGLTILPFSGCGGEMIAQDGDIVQVHYTGTLDDGSQFDSSSGKDPLEFTIGAGQMIPGFEDAVRGMKKGEVKTVTIPAADAYGEKSQEMIFSYLKEDLPEGMDPKVGDQLVMSQSSGGIMPVTVIEITDTTIVIDANHQLAGEDLTFAIELIELTRN